MFKKLRKEGFVAYGLAIIILTVSVCLAFQTNKSSAAGEIFRDVSLSSDYAEAIEYVRDEGIVEGYGDGSFGPEKTINRAEFVKILVGATSPLVGETESGIEVSEESGEADLKGSLDFARDGHITHRCVLRKGFNVRDKVKRLC